MMDYNTELRVTAVTAIVVPAITTGRSVGFIGIATGIEQHKDASFTEWALQRANSLC